ncbi:MAG: hydrogenase iron-sulfur subunit [Candidatus Lokiarchaeota archaeon]|nr:hydrogenase iron-sulfur subunit [Candidatus Lokiarchaeota archaeon]
MEYLKEVIESIGIDPARIRMEFCSSAEGQKFKEIATEFHDQIEKLGKNPLSKGS